ncbi:carboxylating nicotinate-nucleotide diphosphorylase [Candidatus Marinamargulisbacteria bacterium SCGC AG-343-K17]|nr:carboxylating nicotinate-nucleotide diphosphorylase [Candidatus Marinamargulisbacteria bacterium SCGC AG-343-K17]
MDIIDCIKNALNEDKPTIDVTSALLLNESRHAEAHIIAKAPGIFFGQPIVDGINAMTPTITCDLLVQDGDAVAPNDICVIIKGDLRTIVEVERTLLNFLQRLSGVATITNQFVSALDDNSIAILDTRKTTPLLRELEKKAVCAGGGMNHRFGLHDMVLVKENHLHLYLKDYGIDAFNEKIRAHKNEHPTIPIEIEISSIDLLKQIDLSHVDIVMFDNMSIDQLSDCIHYLNSQPKKPLKEVSGNISLDTISLYKGIDIDRISIGSLTHSVSALDLSLLVV